MITSRVFVRDHRRNRFYVRAHTRKIKRPQKIGSYWVDQKKKNVHGPRLAGPNEFERLYLESQDWVNKRKNSIDNYTKLKRVRLPESTRIKIGIPKKNKQVLRIQSFITPIKDWKNVGIPPYKKQGEV